MSNMQPQAPKLNQKTWKYLEDYERELARRGNEEYIFAGCYGDKGKISGKITIPSNCWKIIVVLAAGEDDLKRIDKTTRVIAVDMPNDETVSQRWRTYLTTVDRIEEKTGYDFLSKLAKKVQKTIESAKDQNSETDTAENEPDEPAQAPAAAGKTSTGKTSGDATKGSGKINAGSRVYRSGSRGGCYYLTASGKKSYVDKRFCEHTAPVLDSPENPEEDLKDNTKEETKTVPAVPPQSLPVEKQVVKIGSSSGRTYVRGPRGGCYYLSDSGKKVYVSDKNLCQ